MMSRDEDQTPAPLVHRSPDEPARSIPKVSTGIEGLDRILEGGLPEGRTTLVGGGPGTGKTILGLQFLCGGAEDHPGIFVSFEERPEAVRANALAMGFDIAALEREGKLFLMRAELPREMILAGGFDLKGLLAILAGKARAMGARRIVLDAMDVLLQIFNDPVRERQEFYSLHDWLRDQGLTAIVTVKITPSGGHLYPYLDFMADCVLYLDQRIVGQVRTRRLRVVKYRGSGFLSNEVPYVIASRGIVLMPISAVTLEHRCLTERVSAGTPDLDAATGGGFLRSASIMVGGPSGTGKTTLAATFARGACERRERVLYIDFEQSEGALVNSMLSPGIDLRPGLASGALRIMTAMPESLGAEEHLVRVLAALDDFAPDHLIVDAISAATRMGSEQASFDFMVRLLNECKERGITCLFTNQTRGTSEVQEVSGIPISSLLDVGISLSYLERNGRIERRLLVLKARASAHSLQYHRLEITDRGMLIQKGKQKTNGEPATAGKTRRPRAGKKAR